MFHVPTTWHFLKLLWTKQLRHARPFLESKSNFLPTLISFLNLLENHPPPLQLFPNSKNNFSSTLLPPCTYSISFFQQGRQNIEIRKTISPPLSYHPVPTPYPFFIKVDKITMQGFHYVLNTTSDFALAKTLHIPLSNTILLP